MKFTPWRRGHRNRELDEEIEAHLRMAVADRMARGQSAGEAADAARRELGNVGLVKEVTREQWGWSSVYAKSKGACREPMPHMRVLVETASRQAAMTGRRRGS